MKRALLFILVVLFLIGIANAESLFLHYEGQDNSENFDSPATLFIGQSFMNDNQSFTLNNLSIQLNNNLAGGAYVNVTVMLRSSSNASGGVPYGINNLSTGSVYITDGGGAYTWYNISLAPYLITNGTNYTLVFFVNDSRGTRLATNFSKNPNVYGNISRSQTGAIGNFTASNPDVLLRFYGEIVPVAVNVISPAEAYKTTLSSISFNCSASSDTKKIQNISLWIDNILNYTLSDGVDGFTEIALTRNLALGTHTTKCSAWDNSTTPVQYNSTTKNFEIISWVENSQSYTAITTSKSYETFTINLSYMNANYNNVVANLSYNGTNYVSSKNFLGNDVIFSKSFNIPGVTAEQNHTFYWKIYLTNSSGTFEFNSTMHNQTVNPVNIDNCSAYKVLVYNFTMKDEETLAEISPNSSTTIQVNILGYAQSSNEAMLNYSIKFSGVNNGTICLQNNVTYYRFYTNVKYWTDEYVVRNYNFQNQTITNLTIPYKIDLLDLKITKATQFLISYKNDQFLSVADALISINRKYVSQGSYIPVEVPKTDSNGQATGYFDLNGAVYTIVVSKEGSVLSTFNDIAIFCNNKATGDCTLNLFSPTSTTGTTDYYSANGASWNILFDKTNRNITATFVAVDGNNHNFVLNVTKVDNYMNQTICTQTVSTSSGSLVCNVPLSYGNITIMSELYMDGTFIGSRTDSILPAVKDIFGNNYVTYALILFLSFPMLLVPSVIGVVLGVAIGFVALIMVLGLGNVWLTAGSALVWLVVVVMILIFKFGRRNQS